MFLKRSARDTDDVTLRQTYVKISNWIHRVGFRDFPKTSERTLTLSNYMTPTVRKSFLFSVKTVMYQIISEKHACQSLIALATSISLYIDLPHYFVPK